MCQGNEVSELSEVSALIGELLPLMRRRAAHVLASGQVEDAVHWACVQVMSSGAELERHPDPRAYIMRTVTMTAYRLADESGRPAAESADDAVRGPREPRHLRADSRQAR